MPDDGLGETSKVSPSALFANTKSGGRQSAVPL